MKHYPKVIVLAIIVAIILSIIALNRHYHSPAFRARHFLEELRMVGEPLNAISELFIDIGFITNIEQRHPSSIVKDCVSLGEPAIPIFLPALDDENENVRLGVAEILWEMGTLARSVIPHLIQGISNSADLDHQLMLAYILSGIGGPAIGDLQELAARGSERERLLAANALAQIDCALIDDDLIRHCLDSINSQDSNARLLAVNIITILGPDASDAAGLLIPLLKGHDEQVQLITSVALESIGSPAIPHLIKTLENDNQTLRILVADILTNIDPNIAATESLDILIDIMQDELSPYKREIINIMARMGPAAHKAAPHLLQMVKSSDRKTKLEALIVLQSIKHTDNHTISELMEMLRQPYQ
ncbi:MAG: hypothetical protein GY869_05165, partial [Planctomycetes bacterium]|nr:hypothetical protein [Planctomycetota bacterium]